MFSNSINRHSHERITTDAQLNRIITHNYNAQLTHKTMKKREKRKGTIIIIRLILLFSYYSHVPVMQSNERREAQRAGDLAT